MLRWHGILGLSLSLAGWGQAANEWAPYGNLVVGRAEHTATLLNDGRVLFVGGDCAPPPQAACGGTAEIYDPATKRFSRTGSLRTGRFNHAATLLPDGRVLITGGQSGLRNPTSVEIYDPRTGQFSVNGNLKFDRMFAFSALLDDGRVVVAGRSPAEIYDPRDGTSTLVDFGASEAARPVVLPGQRILFVGGTLTFPAIYDLRTNTLQRLQLADAPPPFDSFYDAVSGLIDGSVLVTGGASSGGWSSAANASRLYRPEGDSFIVPKLLPSMLDYRNAHTSTALPDGSVLLFGGNAGGDMTLTYEIFDPATMRFSQVGQSGDRASHTATLLLDGTVLIAGGSVQTDYVGLNRRILGSVDLFVPAAKIPPPAIYTIPGAGSQGAILHTGSARLASPEDPAGAGEVLEIYGFGMAENARLLPQIFIGGQSAEVLYFGNAPDYPGVFQVNVRVPNSVSPGGTVAVRMRYLDRPSNEVTIGVR